ncbi:MAG: hypothetical protein LBR70_02540 [Lactobacillaceae bacterium]|nr:hypothetical protein [Lactobacillaceae bacterium]
MKKIMLILTLIFAGAVFYYATTNGELIDTDYEHVIEVLEEGETVVVPPKVDFTNALHNVDVSNAGLECEDNDALCVVELAVKCTINPKLNFCDKTKLPRFIFMEDEYLGRPKKIDYSIIKTHPIDMHTVEIQTKSTCDGTWFGLCNGNIIYVISDAKGEWAVKEIYSLDTY